MLPVRPLDQILEATQARKSVLLDYDHTQRSEIQLLAQKFLSPHLEAELKAWHEKILSFKQDKHKPYQFDIVFVCQDQWRRTTYRYDFKDLINDEHTFPTDPEAGICSIRPRLIPYAHQKEAMEYGDILGAIVAKVEEAISSVMRDLAIQHLNAYNPDWAEGYVIKYEVGFRKSVLPRESDHSKGVNIKVWLHDPQQRLGKHCQIL